MRPERENPTVSVVIPTYNEEETIAAVLGRIQAQTYSLIVDVIVVDGRSTDRTREIVSRAPGVRLLDNPGRMQAAALNIALAAATGDVIVRIDGHCMPDLEYVAAAVRALNETGAAMVGGPMRPRHQPGLIPSGIALAMSSPLGAGPARFHAAAGDGWVDTVYLGAFWRSDALAVGGYAEDVGVNEDAELAIKLQPLGRIWLDPRIGSSYEPRAHLRPLARQFFRYGVSRAATVKRHPGSLRARQLAAPALVVGLVSPARKWVAIGYACLLAVAALTDRSAEPEARAGMLLAAPVMHVAWAAGFLSGLLGRQPPMPITADDRA